jgi:HSP20 family protein
MPEKKTDISSHEQQSTLARREPMWSASPFRMLERFADEIDSLFDDVGLGRSWLTSHGKGTTRLDTFVPAVEVHQQSNEFVVRADLPGLKKEDIAVDITEDEVTIAGERRQEQETTERGVYRSERSYGRFTRAIRLPEGAMTDQAKATFKDGVLEIRMPAPPDQVTRGRRLDIKEGTDAKK